MSRFRRWYDQCRSHLAEQRVSGALKQRLAEWFSYCYHNFNSTQPLGFPSHLVFFSIIVSFSSGGEDELNVLSESLRNEVRVQSHLASLQSVSLFKVCFTFCTQFHAIVGHSLTACRAGTKICWKKWESGCVWSCTTPMKLSATLVLFSSLARLRWMA